MGHLDFEHAWQRILKIGARASEVDAHTITLLVAPEAIARGKVIMKAELEHTRREEILATFSAGGMAGKCTPALFTFQAIGHVGVSVCVHTS